MDYNKPANQLGNGFFHLNSSQSSKPSTWYIPAFTYVICFCVLCAHYVPRAQMTLKNMNSHIPSPSSLMSTVNYELSYFPPFRRCVPQLKVVSSLLRDFLSLRANSLKYQLGECNLWFLRQDENSPQVTDVVIYVPPITVTCGIWDSSIQGEHNQLINRIAQWEIYLGYIKMLPNRIIHRYIYFN